MKTRGVKAIAAWCSFLVLEAAILTDAGWAAARGLPAAGEGQDARTLLLYTRTRTSYAIENTLELLKAHLQRVDTRLEAAPLATATSNQLAAAAYLVVFVPTAGVEIPTSFLETIAATNKPVLWVGYGADQLQKLAPFDGQFRVEPFSNIPPATNVTYRGRQWFAPVAPLVEVRLPTQSVAQVVMSLSYASTNAPVPLCWRSREVTFFGAAPDGGKLGHLFSDLVLDFYRVGEVPPSQVFLRIDDYQCASDHREFHRKVDYLVSRGRPFVLSVTPVCAGESGPEQLEAHPEYVAGLRYAQARGGRIVLRGYAPGPSGYEFWDARLDRPVAEATPEYVRERLHKGVRELLKQGLFPLAWQTPAYAASQAARAEVSRVFATGVERIQLSDATERDGFAPAALTRHSTGRLIVPENLGFVALGDSNGLQRFQSEAALLLQLRGSVVGCVVHAYEPLQNLIHLVEMLEGLGSPFLDLAELDHVVRISGTVLLAGHGERIVQLAPGSALRWKAFSRGGRLLEEAQESVSALEERTLRRRGQGDYELFEFTEADR